MSYLRLYHCYVRYTVVISYLRLDHYYVISAPLPLLCGQITAYYDVRMAVVRLSVESQTVRLGNQTVVITLAKSLFVMMAVFISLAKSLPARYFDTVVLAVAASVLITPCEAGTTGTL
jgi:hypothetical protein